jgi:hypothetical protein
MSHVVLLGDSIFDNGAYVHKGEPDVVAQVRGKLPADWRATLLAVDGAVTAGIGAQLLRVPADASHLVLSIGGNDALSNSGILREDARSVAEVLTRIADIRDSFERSYRKMLDEVAKLRLPIIGCTIYDARFPDPQERRHVVAALSFINDIITKELFIRNFSLIDLRLICTEDADYANPIETSAKGGDKIATVIAKSVTTPNHSGYSRVFTS